MTRRVLQVKVMRVLCHLAVGYFVAAIDVVSGGIALAQQPPPGSAASGQSNQQWRRLFAEDLQQVKQLRQAARKGALAVDKPKDDSVAVSAPQVDYSEDGKTVSARGGVVVSRGGVQVEAEEAMVNLDSKEASFDGGLLISSPQGSLAAEKGVVDLERELGVFENIQFSYEEGGYRIEAEKAVKLSENEYELTDTVLTTCDCREGDIPWSLSGSRASITQGGYAHTRDLMLRVRGVPVLYAPYFIFPVKTDRAAGLLVPQMGMSNRDGFRFWQPVFLPLDGSTDLTVTPFIETESRYGSSLKFRKELSLRNSLRGKFLFSDESAREGELRGLRVPDNLPPGTLPDIGTDRIGFMYGQRWRSEDDATIPSSFAADIRYTSDDEFLREIRDTDFGYATSRYQTSTVLFQSFLTPSLTASLGSEYNQVIDFDVKSSDDTVFQRLPEAALDGSYRLYPFGANPLGLKMIVGGAGTVTSFARETGYEGTRTHLAPSVTVPFHYKNYLFGRVGLTGYETLYRLQDVGPTDPFSSSENRRTGAFQYTMGTALERSMEVDPRGFWRYVTGLGAESASVELTKIKHTIEPLVQYTFVPDVDNDSLPLFDSVDRIRNRSLVTVGFDSSVFGKFESRRGSSTVIPELAPRPSDLPELGYQEGIPEMFLDSGSATSYRNMQSRRVNARELLTVSVRESYDYVEAQTDRDPTREPFSDVWMAAGLHPTDYVTVAAHSYVSPYSGALTSWGTTVSARDDRGDRIGATYSFIDPFRPTDSTTNQLQGNAEAVLTDRFKLGFYTQYDLVRSTAIEQAIALRFVSACNCWHIDVGMTETTNPDNQRVNIRFALTGLGDLAQGWMYRNAAMMGQTQ